MPDHQWVYYKMFTSWFYYKLSANYDGLLDTSEGQNEPTNASGEDAMHIEPA